jgi:hypothetical protein
VLEPSERESRFGYFFSALVLLLLVEPIGTIVFGASGERPLGLALLVAMLAGIAGVRPPREWLHAARALAVVGALVGAAFIVRPTPALETASFGVACLFFVLSVVLGLRHVLAPGPVTTNHLLGAMTVYLLIGVTWALLLRIVNRLAPGSFTGLSTGDASEFIYLSFVTLATLGFGDITPTLPLARTLVYLEAVVGQLYVAVLVASLVSRYVSSRPA